MSHNTSKKSSSYTHGLIERRIKQLYFIQINSVTHHVLIIFVIYALHHKGPLQNLGPCHHNIKAGIWQFSHVWPPRYPSDTSTKSTEFCSWSGDSYPKTTQITPVLNSMHWLPVIYRSKYKILVFAYKTLNGTAPPY